MSSMRTVSVLSVDRKSPSLMCAEWLTSMPKAKDLGGFNRFVLAFWMSNAGPVDVIFFARSFRKEAE